MSFFAVAVLPLAAAPARAGVVAAALRVACGVGVHDFGGGAILGEQLGHRPHRLVHVMKEALVGGAEVVEPRFAVGGGGEAVFGAPAVAGETDVAFAAIARERVAFVAAELLLLFGGDEVDEVTVVDVAEQVARFDEVIAGIDVAGVLECEREAAGLAVDAQAGARRPSSPARCRTSGRRPPPRRDGPTPRRRRSRSVRSPRARPSARWSHRRLARRAAGRAKKTTARCRRLRFRRRAR